MRWYFREFKKGILNKTPMEKLKKIIKIMANSHTDQVSNQRQKSLEKR